MSHHGTPQSYPPAPLYWAIDDLRHFFCICVALERPCVSSFRLQASWVAIQITSSVAWTSLFLPFFFFPPSSWARLIKLYNCPSVRPSPPPQDLFGIEISNLGPLFTNSEIQKKIYIYARWAYGGEGTDRESTCSFCFVGSKGIFRGYLLRM